MNNTDMARLEGIAMATLLLATQTIVWMVKTGSMTAEAAESSIRKADDLLAADDVVSPDLLRIALGAIRE